MNWKVYKIHGCDWVVAESEAQAIECWESTTGETIDYYTSGDDVDIEIETKPLSELKFIYDLDETRVTTFDKRIDEVLASGEEKVPFFLASSEY